LALKLAAFNAPQNAASNSQRDQDAATSLYGSPTRLCGAPHVTRPRLRVLKVRLEQQRPSDDPSPIQQAPREPKTGLSEKTDRGKSGRKVLCEAKR
jgi:hypothetical protein